MYSRASEAMWLTMLPKSVRIAWALFITMTYWGEACTATSTPPSGKVVRSASERTTTTGPQPTPGQATSASSSRTSAPGGHVRVEPLRLRVAALQAQRPGLQDHESPVLVQRPFHVLRPAEVRLQPQPGRGEFLRLHGRQAGPVAQLGIDRLLGDVPVGAPDQPGVLFLDARFEQRRRVRLVQVRSCPAGRCRPPHTARDPRPR